MERKNLHSGYIDHHTHRLDQLDHAQKERALFDDVAKELTNAAQILILGPGVAKYHFQTHLIEQYPALAKKVVGCETVDHPTDPQIAEFAQKFFKIGSRSTQSA